MRCVSFTLILSYLTLITLLLVVEPTQLTIKGGVDNFTLGLLTVRGTTGPRAVVECEIGLATQHLLIDGVVSLFGAESAVKVEIDILPSPKFKFSTYVRECYCSKPEYQSFD